MDWRLGESLPSGPFRNLAKLGELRSYDRMCIPGNTPNLACFSKEMEHILGLRSHVLRSAHERITASATLESHENQDMLATGKGKRNRISEQTR